MFYRDSVAGQSLIDMVKKQKMQTGKASMWDNSRFPGVWFLPYGWYSTQGGNTFNEVIPIDRSLKNDSLHNFFPVSNGQM